MTVERRTKKVQMITAFVTLLLLLIIQTVPKNPLLIFERLREHAGFFEVVLLVAYSYFISGKLLTSGKNRAQWRLFMWLFFSAVFYMQLLIGLAGFSSFLMTGKLYLPIPFMIFSAPIFRGYGYFMITLFVSTVIFLGPAWCSYLCYFGAWDNLAAHGKKSPSHYSSKQTALRVGTLFLAVSLPFLLRYFSVSWQISMIPAAAVIVVSFLIIFFFSRRSGTLLHCTSFCPVGLVASVVGKLSLFRVAFDKSCVQCYDCATSCRYGALSKQEVDKKKVGFSCSICGDCIPHCPHGSLGYKLPWLSFDISEKVFTGVIVVTHVVFLAVARV